MRQVISKEWVNIYVACKIVPSIPDVQNLDLAMMPKAGRYITIEYKSLIYFVGSLRKATMDFCMRSIWPGVNSVLHVSSV